MNIPTNLDPSQLISRENTAIRPSSSAVRSSQDVVANPLLTDGDETHLSQAAILAAASSSLSDVRPEKVAAIQQALANNTYAVSASDVAGKLLEHLLQK